jgi:hypothetical protein
MSDLEDFLAQTLQRHALATTGVRNGDATPLIEMLSTREPVTLFPAAQPAKRGWAEVSQAFQRVASLYSSHSNRAGASGPPGSASTICRRAWLDAVGSLCRRRWTSSDSSRHWWNSRRSADEGIARTSCAVQRFPDGAARSPGRSRSCPRRVVRPLWWASRRPGAVVGSSSAGPPDISLHRLPGQHQGPVTDQARRPPGRQQCRELQFRSRRGCRGEEASSPRLAGDPACPGAGGAGGAVMPGVQPRWDGRARWLDGSIAAEGGTLQPRSWPHTSDRLCGLPGTHGRRRRHLDRVCGLPGSHTGLPEPDSGSKWARRGIDIWRQSALLTSVRLG